MYKIEYDIECYSEYNDNPIASVSVDEFCIQNLLTNPNPKVRKFSLIVITKCTHTGNSIIVNPLIAIYDKNVWKVHYRLRKYWLNLTSIGIKTEVFCYHHSLDYNGMLKKYPCKNQEQLIRRYNAISEVINGKDKSLTLKPR